MIFIQIDDIEQAYLKVLCDEVFGRVNFINMIVVNMSNLSGVKMTAAINGKKFPKIKEYILIYAKNKDTYKLDIPKISTSKWDNEYNYIIPEFTREMYDNYTNSNGEIILNNIEKLNLVS
ncbi:MAG: DNA methyltransferase, partial [Clostridia bacterium]